MRLFCLLAATWLAIVVTSSIEEGEVALLGAAELDGAQEFARQSPEGDVPLWQQMLTATMDAQGLSEEEKTTVLKNHTAEVPQAQHAVPDSVACYWELMEEKLSTEATYRVKQREGDAAYDEFSKAEARDKVATTEVAALETKQSSEETELAEAQDKYKELHEEALKLFYTAKGDLNSYKNERKKVDLDAAQSKSHLSTYLKYKKEYIQASADAEDPSTSEEVAHYKKLAEQYLEQYHTVQQAVRQSYSAAKQHQTLYFSLSKEYQGMTEDANDMAKKVEELAHTVDKTKAAIERRKIQHQSDADALPTLRSTNSEKNATATTALNAFSTASNAEADAKLAYYKLTAVAETLTKMAADAKSVEDRNQLRFLDFSDEADDKGMQVEGTIKQAMILKKKYEASNDTAVVYKKSYEMNNCDRVVQEDDSNGMKDTTTGDKEADIIGRCKSDKTIWQANKDAAKRAKDEHMAELNHLAIVRQEHESAVTGRNTAKSLRDAAKAKGDRLGAAAQDLRQKARTPCSTQENEEKAKRA
jgi:hypothetical protein